MCSIHTINFVSSVLAYVESENRFELKVPQGETLYIAAESSSKTQRMCCASNRSFEMQLFDHSRQEAIRFSRKLACSSWLFGCCLQVCYYKTMTCQFHLLTGAFQKSPHSLSYSLVCPYALK